MSRVKKVAYLPEKVAKEMVRHAQNYSSESAFIIEAVKLLNEKEREREQKQ